jgi:hypothetical protein
MIGANYAARWFGRDGFLTARFNRGAPGCGTSGQAQRNQHKRAAQRPSSPHGADAFFKWHSEGFLLQDFRFFTEFNQNL